MLSATFEAEIEAQDLRVARWQRAQRELDLVGEKAVHRFLLRVGHLIGDEPLDERPIALGIHRRVEPDVASVERRKRLNDVDRQAGELRELLRGRLSTELLAQTLGRLD